MTKQNNANSNAAAVETTNTPVYRDTNLRVIFSVTLMAVMGVASITPAFPKIVEVFKITKQQSGLLITVFTFPGILFTPVLGVLADRFGRKTILFPALMVFGVSGFACGFVRDFDLLLVLRFIQGAGAASLGSLNSTLIGDLYSGKQLNAAMGYNAGVLSVGTASYPAIGGFLATFGWHYPFFLPVLAIPTGFIVLLVLKNPEPDKRQSLKEYLKNAAKIFHNKQVFALFLTVLITFILIYGTALNYYPFFMQKSFGSSTLIIGLMLSVMSIASALTSANLGRLSKKYREKKLLVAGCILYVLSMIMLPYVPNIWFMIIPTALFGMANGLNIPTIQGLLASLSPIQYRAAFMSANGMVLRIGQTIGPITMMGILFISGDINGIFYASTGFAFIMLMLMAAMPANDKNGKPASINSG